MDDVFVSYKTEDRARVRPLVDALSAAGLTVWWDVHIEGGAAWREVITQRLDTAKCVVVVWSRQSIGATGRFVQDEASHADRHGTYLPIAIDAVDPPLGFGQQQVLPLIGWHGNAADPHLTDILAAVQAMVAGGPRPVPRAPSLAAARRKAPGWRLPLIAGATAVVLATGAAWVFAPQQLCGAAGIACARGAARAPANSIAVLPFANLSGDPRQDYFSDGLSDELIGKLARIDRLQVAARTSAFRFKGSKDSSASIATKLGVAYLLDGSVRREGNVVRVSAQLVEGGTGFERWSQTYDRDMKDIFAVQSGIAEAVSEALKVKLLGADIDALSRGGTSDPAAWDPFLRGQRLFDAGAGEAGMRDALAQFDAALARDNGFAAAHAARARALLALANQYASGAELRPLYDQALIAARRAVALAPALPEAETTLAVASVYANLDFAAARAAYASAIKSGNGSADTLLRFGYFSVASGDTAPGLDALQRAVTLDPLNPRAYKTLGLALLLARRYDAAIAAQRRALELSPATANSHAEIAKALTLLGKPREALIEIAREPVAWERQTATAIIQRKLGNGPAAAAAAAALGADDSSAMQQAQIAAQAGDAAGALAAIDRAFRVGDPGVLVLKTDPWLDPLRPRADFAARVARLGLPR